MKKFLCDMVCVLMALALVMILGAAIEATLSLPVALLLGGAASLTAYLFYQLGWDDLHLPAIHLPALHRPSLHGIGASSGKRRVSVTHPAKSSLRAA